MKMVRPSTLVLLVLVATVQFGGVSAFIWNFPAPPPLEDCPATPPCQCSGTTISCKQKHLTSVPHFNRVTVKNTHGSMGQGRDVELDLSSNSITVIPANAFANITFEQGVHVTLDLANNLLTHVANHALRGMEASIKILILNNNHLTSIPADVATLSQLTLLNVNGNPISSLTSSAGILQSIGPHVTNFQIDLTRFSSWPNEMSYLTRITSLTLTKNAPLLPVNAFNSFNSIYNLYISNSTLDHIPEAVCHLSSLVILEVKQNSLSRMTSSVFDSHCMQTRMMYRIDLENNGITSIPNDLTSSDLTVDRVNLDHNQLTSFPRVLNLLNNVTIITIRYNKITSLNRADLHGLVSLSGLYISNNPISSISTDTFTDTIGLESLDLDNTFVGTIPASLVPLPIFRILYVRNAEIQCSCSAMSYLKPFKSWRYQLFGKCATTGMDFNTYARGALQHCH